MTSGFPKKILSNVTYLQHVATSSILYQELILQFDNQLLSHLYTKIQEGDGRGHMALYTVITFSRGLNFATNTGMDDWNIGTIQSEKLYPKMWK